MRRHVLRTRVTFLNISCLDESLDLWVGCLDKILRRMSKPEQDFRGWFEGFVRMDCSLADSLIYTMDDRIVSLVDSGIFGRFAILGSVDSQQRSKSRSSPIVIRPKCREIHSIDKVAHCLLQLVIRK
jgi:hypothetical protein